LKKSTSRFGAASATAGRLTVTNQPLSDIAGFLESEFNIQVIDRTGLTNRFDIDLKWKETDLQHPNLDALKQALLDQLGLELVPGREPVNLLIVEKVEQSFHFTQFTN
jgi:uncharacterized protein (TIGR03435 family)